MECEWCGSTRKLTAIGNLTLCPTCESTKANEDAFDEFFANRDINGKGNMEAFFNSIGQMFIQDQPNMVEYLFSN